MWPLSRIGAGRASFGFFPVAEALRVAGSAEIRSSGVPQSGLGVDGGITAFTVGVQVALNDPGDVLHGADQMPNFRRISQACEEELPTAGSPDT
jgi:hypothetical protein